MCCKKLKWCLGVQGLIGAGAVVLPGTTLGKQATLAPLAVPAIGSTVKGKTIHIGSPAVATKVKPLNRQHNTVAHKQCSTKLLSRNHGPRSMASLPEF